MSRKSRLRVVVQIDTTIGVLEKRDLDITRHIIIITEETNRKTIIPVVIIPQNQNGITAPDDQTHEGKDEPQNFQTLDS